MDKRNEDLTSDQLIKKRKTTIVVIWLLIIAVILSLLALLYDLFLENTKEIIMLTPVLVCTFFALYMAQGLKKLNKELEKRKDN